MNKPNIVSALIGVAISTYILLAASRFPSIPGSMIGPGYFPVMLAIGLMCTSMILLIQAILKKGKLEYSKLDVKSPELIRSFLSLVATVLYAILMQFTGFIVATVFYLFYLMYLLKNRNIKQMTILSVLISIAVYIVFKGVLNLTLPTGFLI